MAYEPAFLLSVANPTLNQMWEQGDESTAISFDVGLSSFTMSGNTLALREMFGDILDTLDRHSRQRSMRLHPSMFQPECEGSDMPAAGAPIPPGTGYVPPAIEAAVDWLELAGDLDFDVRSSSMMRQRDVQADELGEPWDLISDPDEAA